MTRTLKTDIDRGILLDALLGMTNEMLAIVDKEGKMVEISQAYAEFLKIPRKEAIGKHVTEVIDNTRLHIVAKTGIPEIEQVQKIDGHDAIVTRLPIMEEGNVIGSFARILFKDTHDLDTLYYKMHKIENELQQYKRQFGEINTSRYTLDDIIGKSPLITKLKDTVKRIARTQSSVIILGESGTGKELFAHSIHNASRRAEFPFITVNCGSIPSELMESEFFGYEDGTFTGAKKGGKNGLFQAAHMGTIFLDEISDLPLQMQVKLLRVLQEREVRKVGASVNTKVDLRVIAASNKDPYQLIEEKKFRSDLYYRLNVISLRIPALRERKEDIPLLAERIVKKLAAKEHLQVDGISASAMEFLKNYSWPGNVRELENTLESALNFMGIDRVIRLTHLPGNLLNKHNEMEGKLLSEIIGDAERFAIVSALHQNRGKRTKAAKTLGISRTSLYEKMQKYEIDPVESED